MKLSVCMIVKNEEKVLARILKQVIKFCDELIVVDTGSTDKTKDIAKKFTNNVYDFEWCDDFSKARNFSFSKATCPYIMWLDADDFINEENITKIIQLKKKNDDFDIYMCKYQVAFDENNRPTFEYYRERIVRNCDTIKWRGFVHEAITLTGKLNYTDICIQHRKVEVERDSGRNLKIYEKHIANGEKLDARGMFYFARELYFNDRIDDAITTFEKYLTHKNKYTPNVIDAHLMLSKCYISKNDHLKAKNILIESIKILPPNGEICCALGDIYHNKNNLSHAIFWYTTATICPLNLESGGFVQKDYYDFIPYLQLSCIYYNLKNYDKFEYYHNKAKGLKPSHPSIIFNQQFVRKNK